MRQLKILVVDNNPEFLDSVTRFLSWDPGYEVIGRALDGLQGVKLCEKLAPDLVLMDISMPIMNGLDATREIKARTNSPKVVVLTLHDLPGYEIKSRDAGADGFVGKQDFAWNLPPLLEKLFPFLRAASAKTAAA